MADVKLKTGAGLAALLVAGVVVTQIDRVGTGRTFGGRPTKPNPSATNVRRIDVVAFTTPYAANLWVDADPGGPLLAGLVVSPGRMEQAYVYVRRNTRITVRVVTTNTEPGRPETVDCGIRMGGRELAVCGPLDDGTATAVAVIP